MAITVARETYKFYAEALIDAESLMAKLFVTPGYVYAYRIEEYRDTETGAFLSWLVELTCTHDMQTLLGLMTKVVDSHVMYRTLNTAAEFTGARIRD